jgi:hypothetical protein
MTTGQNPKRQVPDPKENPNSENLGDEECAVVRDFNFQNFFGVWSLAFEICPPQRAAK